MKKAPVETVTSINFSPNGDAPQKQVNEELVKKIFAALKNGNNVNLCASETGSAQIIAAVIHHLIPLPMSVQVICQISELVGFKVVARAPLTHVELSYWYQRDGDYLTYATHKFAKFQTPPFSGGGIKSLIESGIMNPEIAIASSLNQQAKHLHVDGGIEAVIFGISAPKGRSTVTQIGQQ